MRRTIAMTTCLIVAVWAGLNANSIAQAQDYGEPAANPNLFYNYYAPPVESGYGGAVGAQLYVSPRPVPEFVGHTYYTYQPLQPHEYLYPHERTYTRDNGMAGTTTTKVVWSRSTCLSGVSDKVWYRTTNPARPIFQPYVWGF